MDGIHTMTVALTGADATRLVMFPNGAKFNATDGFVGSGFITRLIGTNTGTGAATLTCSLWDAVSPTTGRAVIGGTGAPLDRFRLIGGAAALTQIGDWVNPFWKNAPDAQVTGARLVAGGIVLGRADQNRAFDIPIHQAFPGGMILSLDVANVANSNPTITIEYVPWVSGGTRRRQLYRPGLTVRTVPVEDLVL